MYLGNDPVEIDPTRIELWQPKGFYKPTKIKIGNLETIFKAHGIPKTVTLNWSNLVLDCINFAIPAKQSNIKSVVFIL